MGYVKRNALELLKFGHSLIKHVARGIFLLFMTLMVAGYIMHTREAIVGFFRSLLPPLLAHRLRSACSGAWTTGLSGVVRGQLSDLSRERRASAIGFWMFDLEVLAHPVDRGRRDEHRADLRIDH